MLQVLCLEVTDILMENTGSCDLLGIDLIRIYFLILT